MQGTLWKWALLFLGAIIAVATIHRCSKSYPNSKAEGKPLSKEVNCLLYDECDNKSQ